MLKKLFLLFTLCLASHAVGMESMDIEQEVIPVMTVVPTLKELCGRTIRAHKNNFTLEQIAELPVAARDAFLFQAAVDVLGPVPSTDLTQFLNANASIYAACISRDDKLIIACADNKLRIYDKDGKQCAECNGHTAEVWAVCVGHDNQIISASHDGTLRIWDINGNQRVVRNGYSPTDVCVTHDNAIVVGCLDHTVRVLDMNGDVLRVCDGHTAEVWSVCVTHDNNIVSGSEDGTIRVWNMHPTSLTNEQDLRRDNQAIAPEERRLVQGEQLAECNGHTGAISVLCITHDNKIISASKDSTVRVWDMTGKQIVCCNGHQEMVISVCVNEDNLIISTGADKTMRLWDLSGQELAFCKCPDEMWSVMKAPNNTIIAGSADGGVYIWDTKIINCLQNSNSAQARHVWSFLQMVLRLFVLSEDGQVKNPDGCWEQIHSLMEEYKDKKESDQAADDTATGGERDLKRQKSGE